QKNGPSGQAAVWNCLNHTCQRLEDELPRSLIRMPSVYVFGSHDRMKDHERRLGFIARSGLPVLIEGECGTGKEALAELVHELSGIGNEFTRIWCRQSGPLLRLSQMGGNHDVKLSQLCEGASRTLFLKNVHTLSPVVQEEFLTALDQRDERNGAGRPASARLISSATDSLDS